LSQNAAVPCRYSATALFWLPCPYRYSAFLTGCMFSSG
jgi:hypothetical protein